MKERPQDFLWNRKARMMRRFESMDLQASYLHLSILSAGNPLLFHLYCYLVVHHSS